MLDEQIVYYFIKYNNGKVGNSEKELLFKNLNLNQENKDIRYMYDEFEISNLNTQNSFYSFNISCLEYFHDMIKLKKSNNQENQLKEEYIKAYYEINLEEMILTIIIL